MTVSQDVYAGQSKKSEKSPKSEKSKKSKKSKKSDKPAPAPKFLICHHASTVQVIIIEVSGNALPAHFSHGDFFLDNENSCVLPLEPE